MRKPIRAVGIVIKDTDVLLMWRKNNKEYYVFPGGGVEANETIEEAVIREIYEESTLTVKIEKLLYHLTYFNSDKTEESEQFFYKCSYVSGEPKLQKGSNEYRENAKGEDLYTPLWVPLHTITQLTLYPMTIRNWLIEDFKNNFASPVREAGILMK